MTIFTVIQRNLTVPDLPPRVRSTQANEATHMRRILIVENELLLGAGIEHLLTGEADLDVTGIAGADEAILLKEIKHFQPDVVILDRATCLIHPTKLLAQLQDYPHLRVIVISADDNTVQIFEKQQILVTRIRDLASLFYTVINYSRGGTEEPIHEPKTLPVINSIIDQL